MITDAKEVLQHKSLPASLWSRQSVVLPGSKTIPSPIHSTPKLPCTRLTSIRSHPLLHSNFLAVMLLLIYKDQTKLSLVNMQLAAYTLALLSKREHIRS